MKRKRAEGRGILQSGLILTLSTCSSSSMRRRVASDLEEYRRSEEEELQTFCTPVCCVTDFCSSILLSRVSLVTISSLFWGEEQNIKMAISGSIYVASPLS